MAEEKDLDFTYSLIDNIFRLSLGETGSFSGAMYDGDFSLSLEEAQRRKHAFVAESLNIGHGSRVLDMGCGWGPFLKFLQDLGADGVGVTLSSAQMHACRKKGFDVHLMDCRSLKPDALGTFDAIVSLGAFEHFSSKENWIEGRQDEIYHSFFKHVYDLLRNEGRFFLQTMVFGKNMIDPEEIDINAEKESDAHICALMERQFPGSWLPHGIEQIISNAEPYFNLIHKSNGRLDYIETQKQWRKKFREFSFRKYLYYISLFPAFLKKGDLRKRINPFGVDANCLCFEREIIDHFRLVFEKA